MSDLSNFSQGASILQQVDVSDIFKNLALGIAEAQQKLDDNSIAQAVKLAETQIGGSSLLALGFVPTFYAFHYADISASIYLKMAQKESLEFGFGLDLQIASDKGFKEDTHTFLSENSYSETTEEYKATRQLNFFAKEKKAVKINTKLVKQREDLFAKSRLERFKQDIKYQKGVDQVYDEIQSKKVTNNTSVGVDVWMDGGFLRVEQGLHFNKDGVGVLKIGNMSDTTNNTFVLDPEDEDSDFTLGSTSSADPLLATLNLANPATAGTIYGLSKTGEFYLWDSTETAFVPISSTFYFAYNSDEINYTGDLKYNSSEADLTHQNITGLTNRNHDQHKLIHQALRLVSRHDPDAFITITGETDPKGGTNKKNESLALRRAEKLKAHIFGSDAFVEVETVALTNLEGASDLAKRNASIKLDADYIFFIDGSITTDATPAKDSASPNRFIYVDEVVTPGGPDFHTATFAYGGVNYTASDDNFEELIGALSISEHSYENTTDGLHYFLSDEAVVKFLLLTNQSEEIQIDYAGESGSNGTENSNSFFAGKTKNQKSMLNEAIGSKAQNNSFALSASVDFRMSRQFEMSMEGNSSMSARMVAVPAPAGFTDFIDGVYNAG
ncbi:MAG: hypothetical protein ACO1N0_05485 [Fluviicola sp.]